MGINKRGLSTIIATVMLILLTLIAIFLLWFFLRPTIVGTDEKLGTTADCINVRVEPVSCEYYKSKQCSGTVVGVGVRRTAGVGDYNTIKFLFTKNENQPFNMEYTSLFYGNKNRLNETQYGNYGGVFLDSQGILKLADNLTSFNAAVLVGKNKKVCNPLTIPVPCVAKENVNINAEVDIDGEEGLDFFDFLNFLKRYDCYMDLQLDPNGRDMTNCNKLDIFLEGEENNKALSSEEACKKSGVDSNLDGNCNTEDFFAFCGTFDALSN